LKKSTGLFTKQIFVVLGLALALSSCNKKPEQIGIGVIPDVGKLTAFYTDTISVVAYSLIEDSIRTDEPSNILLGSIKDPVFGKTSAGFYTQFSLSTNGHSFGDNPVLDSLVLQIAYAGYYGDTTTTQYVRAYEMEEQIFPDSIYHSKRVIPCGATDYANYTFDPRPNSPFVYLGDTLSPLIRIRLSDISSDLGNKLLNATEDEMASKENFQAFFKGLHLVTDQVTSGGAVTYLNLTANLSRMTIYYSNDTEDSLRYDFYVASSNARFNHFDHNAYADADETFKQQLINGDTLLGNKKIYVQSMGGVKTFIRFPHLGNFANTLGHKVLINEAKLILTNYDPDTVLTPPSQLALVAGTEEKGKYKVLEDQLEGDNYFGGTYKESVNAYEFRLTRKVQQIILDGPTEPNYGLYTFVLGSSSKSNRLIINGSQPEPDTLKALRLKVVYTLID